MKFKSIIFLCICSLYYRVHPDIKKTLNTEMINELIKTMNNELAILTVELEALHAIECTESTTENCSCEECSECESIEEALVPVTPLAPHTPAWVTTLITISDGLVFYTNDKQNYFVGSAIHPESPVFEVTQGDHDLSIIYNNNTNTWQLWGYNQAHTIFNRENGQTLVLECNSEGCQKILELQATLNKTA